MDYSNQLTVKFNELRSGWLTFTVATAGQTFQGSFSVVYDPLIDLKHWLEAIAIGVQQASFTYDREGEYVNFNLESYCSNNDVITISEANNERIIIKTETVRKQLVEQFYLGFVNFANSDFARVKWIEEQENGYEWTKVSEFYSYIIDNYLELNSM